MILLRYLLHPKFAPSLIVVLFVYTAIRYLFERQWWTAIYWFAAGLINFSVIMMDPK